MIGNIPDYYIKSLVDLEQRLCGDCERGKNLAYCASCKRYDLRKILGMPMKDYFKPKKHLK